MLGFHCACMSKHSNRSEYGFFLSNHRAAIINYELKLYWMRFACREGWFSQHPSIINVSGLFVLYNIMWKIEGDLKLLTGAVPC